MVAAENFDIVAITESWIKVDTRDFIGEFQIEGYKMYNKDRKSRQGGGVMLYVRESLRSTLSQMGDTDDYDLLGVDIKAENLILRIGIVYRPPASAEEIDNSLYTTLGNFIRGKDVILMGDFNNGRVDYDSLHAEEAEGVRLVEFLQDNFLVPKVTEGTREGRVLDLIMTNNESLIPKCEIGEQLDRSDHNVIRLEINVDTVNSKNLMLIPNYNYADLNSLRRDVVAINAQELLERGTAVEAYDTLIDELKKAEQQHVPYRMKRVKNKERPPWFSSYIGAILKNRNMAYKRWKLNPTNIKLNEYVKARRETKRQIRRAKRELEHIH